MTVRPVRTKEPPFLRPKAGNPPVVSGKQMEGDNQRRRALGRQSRQRGRQPSETKVTLGASKQVEHRDDKRRNGPPAAGGRKPVPGSG